MFPENLYFYTIISQKYWGVSENKTVRLNRRKILAVGGLAVVALLVMFALLRKKSSQVKDILVDIKHLSDGQNDLIKDKDIKEIIKRSFDANLNESKVGQIDVKRVENVLEQDPFIENAEVFIDVANNLDVKITQREPISRIIDNNGLNYYLDKNGIRMPPSKYFSARVLVITGAVTPHVADFLARKKYGLKDVFNLVLRLKDDPFYGTFIQQIQVDAGGEFTLVPVLGDQKIRIGSIDDLEDKLQRIRVFYDEAMPYEGWRKYASISVKFKGQIVCKKK